MTTRDRAALSLDEHTEQLAAQSWLSVQDLAARWSVAAQTVRNIPREALPYITLGASEIRRYQPSAVLAFEQRGGVAA